jgi:hypothetical protein
VSSRSVAFDEWQHVAVYRHGNGGQLYVNGSLQTTNAGFWNGPGDLVVGGGPGGVDLFDGAIDDFFISGFTATNNTFSSVEDIEFFDPENLSGVLGDVDQNGIVDQDDYAIWSANAGFDNGLGAGDPNTLFVGDVDQNGRVNFFDFNIIVTEAMAAGSPIVVPEPAGSLLLIGLIVSAAAFFDARRRIV